MRGGSIRRCASVCLVQSARERLTGRTARDKVRISWKNQLIQNGESRDKRDEDSRRRLGAGQGQQIPLRLKRLA